MANRHMQARLSALEGRLTPRWNCVLVIPNCPPEEWEQAVEAALQAAPAPPRGSAYLVVPAESAPDSWEREARAEMEYMRRKFGLADSPHE